MKKTFKITVRVKSPSREDDHEILQWRLSLLTFIMKWLRRNHTTCSFEPVNFIKSSLEDNCYYLSFYTPIKNYFSPYFNIKDIRHYEEEKI